MKANFKKIMASFLAALMLFSAAPLQGFTDISLKLPDWLSTKANASYIGTYNATAAVEYARKYALNYNKEWYFYVNGGDCANFVSQSLFVAGVPMTANWHCYDCNSTAYVMSDNYTWIRAQQLMDYLISIGGQRIDNPSPSDFSLGDAVFYNWNGGRIDHSAIVTAIDGGVPKVSCHSTPEMSSKLDYHWTLGKDKSCAVLIKLNGDVCTKNNAPDYDIYKLNSSTGLYSNPGSGFIQTISYRNTVRVVEITQSGGKLWGKFNYKGTWGWVDLSKASNKGHVDRIQVDHLFGDWFTVTPATCISDGLERRECTRCGYTEDRPIANGGHAAGSPATCLNASVCTACGTTITPALGHDFTSWGSIKAPTCIQREVFERTCRRCNTKETKNGDFGTHNYLANVTNPSCTTSGTSTMTCSYCKDSYIEDIGTGWSGWTEDVHNDLLSDPELYEKKVEYRYKDKETTSSSNSYLDGWTHYYTERTSWGSTQGPVYSDPSDGKRNVWSEQYNTGYEKKTVNVFYKYGYSELDYSYSYETGGRKRYEVELDYYPSSSGQRPVSKEGSGFRWYASGGTSWAAVYDAGSREVDDLSRPTTSTRWYYQEPVYTYYFYRWPASWSDWQTSAVSANDNRQVETRTLYRYKIAALGHNFGSPMTSAATCTEQGCKYRICSRCNYKYEYDFTPALGHNWGGWYTVIEAKPGQAGLERRDCQRCGIFETRGHNLIATVTEPTCTEKGYTSYKCKDSGCSVEYKSDYVNALGHNLRTTPEMVTYPTCTENGVQKYTCTRCDYYKNETVPALGHDYDRNNDGTVDKLDAVKTVEPTCLKDGYHYFECENADEHNYTTVIPATGHDMCEWITITPETCGDEGYSYRECMNDYCDITVVIRDKERNYYEEKDNNFLQHKYGDTIDSFATCTSDGYSTRTCEICGDVILTPGDSALGHDWGEWVTESNATCTEEGLKRQSCQRCGIYNDEVTPPLGHDDISEVFTANCVSKSGEKNTCQRCGRVEILYDGDVDADSHDMGQWYLEKAATCTEPGFNRRDCNRNCGYFEREPITVTGHNYKETLRTEADCENDGKIVHECQNEGCDAEIIENTMKLGHEFRITTIPPSCTEDGYDLYECMRDICDFTEKKDFTDALGHEMGQWNVVKLPTATQTGLEARDCIRNDKHEERIIPVLKTYTATFVAEGSIIAKIEFVEGATELSYEPDVPQKDRYTAQWEDYTLGNSDITINAKYNLIPPEGLSGIETEKKAEADEALREVTISLKASSDAKTIVTESTEKTPLDIILVVDQSGSMEGAKNQKLKEASEAITELIFEESKLNNVDHRLAIVGFAMGSYTQDSKNYPAYMNSEILTTGSAPIQYSTTPSAALNNAYKNSLVSVNNNGTLNTAITKAIESIDAKGATAVNVGLTMAANIFASNSIEGTDRQRVVILMTDGEPTSYSNYDENGIANPAILLANQLKSADNKDGCGATVYSIGIDCNTERNKRFLNAVSSYYDSVESMKSDISKDTNEYFLYSDDIDTLEDMFVEVIRKNMINTTDFKDITIVDTISSYFTMTSQQEAAFRESVVSEYNITNSDITVTRNQDGTTTIKIEHIEPKPITGTDGKTVYSAEVQFTVSANGNALSAGTYATNTEDAGVILPGADSYEKLFKNQSVSFSKDAGAAIFSINGEIYQITSVEPGGTVTAPDYRVETGYTFSKWDVPLNYVLDGGVVEFDAILDKVPYTVTWNIGEEKTETTYYAGEYIYPPDVPENLEGLTFIGWNTAVPAVMPEKNLEFTACYSVHTHNFVGVETVKATCTSDGLMTYTCSCSESYTEKINALGGDHEWIAITSEAALDNLSLEEFRCNKCNEYMSRALVYKVVSSTKNYRGNTGKNYTIYDFSMYNVDAVLSQPENTVTISMPVPKGMENASTITVYRIEDDGTETRLESTYNKNSQQITFVTDHFCEFKFVADHQCGIKGNIHPDENNDFICDHCLYSAQCSMCEMYMEMKDTPVIGAIITLIHFFIHLVSNIKSVTG